MSKTAVVRCFFGPKIVIHYSLIKVCLQNERKDKNKNRKISKSSGKLEIIKVLARIIIVAVKPNQNINKTQESKLYLKGSQLV